MVTLSHSITYSASYIFLLVWNKSRLLRLSLSSLGDPPNDDSVSLCLLSPVILAKRFDIVVEPCGNLIATPLRFFNNWIVPHTQSSSSSGVQMIGEM